MWLFVNHECLEHKVESNGKQKLRNQDPSERKMTTIQEMLYQEISTSQIIQDYYQNYQANPQAPALGPPKSWWTILVI